MRLTRETQLTVAMAAFVIVAVFCVGQVVLRSDVFGRYLPAPRIVRRVDRSSPCVAPVPVRIAGTDQESGKTQLQPLFVVLADIWGFPGGTWKPTPADIDGVEASICQVATLSDATFSEKIQADYYDFRIEHPEQYYRQYFGVIRNGTKYIYINAVCEHAVRESLSRWRSSRVGAEGGGRCYWQAFYDPLTRQISDLKVNGPM